MRVGRADPLATPDAGGASGARVTGRKNRRAVGPGAAAQRQGSGPARTGLRDSAPAGRATAEERPGQEWPARQRVSDQSEGAGDVARAAASSVRDRTPSFR